MPIAQGQSEIDSVVLRLPDVGKEIKNWLSYSTTSHFLQPCDRFTFRISGEDTGLYQDLLVPGAKVQLVVNNKVQCTGYIDDRNIKYNVKTGTIITITGRDILSRMVNGNIDPNFRLKKNMTVADVISAAMVPFGIDQLYNTPGTHLNIITGRPNNESLKVTSYVAPRYQRGPDGSYSESRQDVTVTEVVANKKPGLKDLKIQDYKAKPNEGAYEFCARMVSRAGLMVKAVADGSGLMVIAPEFEGPVDYNLICKRDSVDENNVLEGEASLDWSAQPSVIVARGFGGGSEFSKSNLYVIMVNELTGLDANGQPMPQVSDLKKTYKNAKLIPIRPQVIPLKQGALSKTYAYCPMFVVDNESKTFDQLEFFVKRKMAELQMKGLAAKYSVVGHTYKGQPWAVNTLVNVNDDINDIHEDMWCLERTFTKSRDGGTITNLTLIRKHTLLIG